MINELKEIMHLSTSVGWLIAKSAFADIMTKIEQGRISWDDPDSLWRARMDGKSDAFMGQSRGAHLGGTRTHATRNSMTGSKVAG